MLSRNTEDRRTRSRIGVALCASGILSASTVGCAAPLANQDPTSVSPAPAADDQPNILMIMLDDLGYADIGAYGGNAATPNLDALAQDGIQFSNFHAYPVCAPTRAALITGQDPHRVGLGSMDGLTPPGVPTTTPGYSGSLEGTYTGIAEILSDAGYATYHSGKWHLGEQPAQSPAALGFDHNFTLYDGGASHYADAWGLSKRGPGQDKVHYERDGERIDTLPDDFYSSRAYTDEMLKMIDDGEAQGDTPFFGYLAYTAVHDPLHMPDQELIDQYLEQYLDNNDFRQLRSERVGRLADKGLIDRDVAIRWADQTPDWDTLTDTQRRDLAYRMAVYDAMIDDVDRQIGRVIDHLKDAGEYDDTVIVVSSDNGAAGASRLAYNFQPGGLAWQDEHFPLVGDMEAYGREGSYPTLGFPNAQVSGGPYYHSKTTVFEGGVRVPAIIKTPGSSNGGGGPRVVDTFAHVADLYPTFADYAGADLRDTELLLGDSAKPLLDGVSDHIGDEDFGMESFGNRAFWEGDWKLVYAPVFSGGTGNYALYNLATDPGETTDLIDAHPDIAGRLVDKWQQYAAANGVVEVPIEVANAAAERANPLMYAVDWVE